MKHLKDAIYIIGASDSWVAEIVDVAIALGRECRIIPVRPIGSAKWLPIACKVSELSELGPNSLVFTGSDIDPELHGQIYSRIALEPFRGLLAWQNKRNLSNWVNLVHPTAWLSPAAELGEDIFVGAHTSIGANTKIRDHVRINRNVSVGHDVEIGIGCEIAPCSAISSGATVEEWVFVGAGAVVLNGLRIGAGATVGAGSIVTRDVLPGQVVVGNPARPKS